MAEKITRTVVTHGISFAKVDGEKLVKLDTIEMAKRPGTRELSKMSKELGAQVVITADTPVERKYEMKTEDFMKYATLV